MNGEAAKMPFAKGQSAMEYMITYSWAILVIAVAVTVLYFFIASPRLASPTMCVFTIGVYCQDMIFSSNSFTTSMQLFLTNSQSFALIAPQIQVNYSSSLTAGSCSPYYILQGGAIICNATLSQKATTQGALVSGKVSISAIPCQSGNVVACQSSQRQTYVGTFSTQVSPTPQTFVAQFNGISSNVVVANVLVPYVTNTFSESAWIKFSSLPTSGSVEIAGEGTPSNCGGGVYCLSYSFNHYFAFGFAGCGTINTGVSITPVINTWYNIVGVFNTLGVNSIYVNGVQDASGSLSLCNSPSNFKIGSDGNSDFFPGNIANVQLYNFSLTSAQVTYLYNNGINSGTLPVAGLLGWWPLGGNANDYSGHANNGAASSVTYVTYP